MALTSFTAEFTSMVTLHHHDFRVERLRMWWHLFSTAEQVRIKDDFGRVTSLLTMQVKWDLIQDLTSFWDLALRCVSIGSVDLVPLVDDLDDATTLSSLNM